VRLPTLAALGCALVLAAGCGGSGASDNGGVGSGPLPPPAPPVSTGKATGIVKPWVTTSGGKFVDQSGRPVILHGFDMSVGMSHLAPVAQQLGANMARVYVGWDAIQPEAPKNGHYRWDAKTLGEWAALVDGADVVINPAGRSVNCRYTPENRREILAARIDSARAVGQAIAQAKQPPRVWLRMSTATIYAHRYDAPNDEATGIIGGVGPLSGHPPVAPDTWRFSLDVALAWEPAADEAVAPQTRKRVSPSSFHPGSKQRATSAPSGDADPDASLYCC